MYDSKNIDNETIFENIQHILNYSDKQTDANVKSRLKKSKQYCRKYYIILNY